MNPLYAALSGVLLLSLASCAPERIGEAAGQLSEARARAVNTAAQAYIRQCMVGIEVKKVESGGKNYAFLPETSSCADGVLGQTALPGSENVARSEIVPNADKTGYVLTVEAVSGKTYRHDSLAGPGIEEVQ
ncbi:hypothetical protein [Deinococcus aquaedulcis]|uniref:hypothetical protein n=1 Tax=Deinococcus aquaedulcis TaxID=2840455 RepID=UPI001C830A4D|nr:hypothetical protein [Deinococcus aquaedulcis]